MSGNHDALVVGIAAAISIPTYLIMCQRMRIQRKRDQAAKAREENR